MTFKVGDRVTRHSFMADAYEVVDTSEVTTQENSFKCEQIVKLKYKLYKYSEWKEASSWYMSKLLTKVEEKPELSKTKIKGLSVYETNQLGTHWVQGVDQVLFYAPSEMTELQEEVGCLLEDVKILKEKLESNNSEAFKPGDVVVLKSGGPRMVVNEIVYEKERVPDSEGSHWENTSKIYGCRCNWFEKTSEGKWGELQTDVFMWESLTLE